MVTKMTIVKSESAIQKAYVKEAQYLLKIYLKYNAVNNYIELVQKNLKNTEYSKQTKSFVGAGKCLKKTIKEMEKILFNRGGIFYSENSALAIALKNKAKRVISTSEVNKSLTSVKNIAEKILLKKLNKNLNQFDKTYNSSIKKFTSEVKKQNKHIIPNIESGFQSYINEVDYMLQDSEYYKKFLKLKSDSQLLNFVEERVNNAKSRRREILSILTEKVKVNRKSIVKSAMYELHIAVSSFFSLFAKQYNSFLKKVELLSKKLRTKKNKITKSIKGKLINIRNTFTFRRAENSANNGAIARRKFTLKKKA